MSLAYSPYSGCIGAHDLQKGGANMLKSTNIWYRMQLSLAYSWMTVGFLYGEPLTMLFEIITFLIRNN